MTYIVNDKCIKCKYTDCVEVCPVDCFYEGVNMLVIKSDECIDCGVCEPECPVDAIIPDTLLTEPDKTYWIEFNDLLVTFGQNLCKPVSPMCSKCKLAGMCPKVGVRKSR